MVTKNIKSRSVVFTTGAVRTAALDLKSQHYFLMPNSISRNDFFRENPQYNLKVPAILANNFPNLVESYFSPYLIESIILEYNSQLNYSVLLNVLNNCNIVIKLDGLMTYSEIETMLELFKAHSITVSLTNPVVFTDQKLIELTKKYYNIIELYIPATHVRIEYFNQTVVHFYRENNPVKNSKTQDEFIVHRLLFFESKKHNPYFNRKLYINKEGVLKNAPELECSYGQLYQYRKVQDLLTILSSMAFQMYWNVPKHLCDVCRDCEFRNMCVDNRTPNKRKEYEWFYKEECPYNPYIAKWKGDEGYRTLKECGVISNTDGFSIDHDKIAQINKELWGE